MDYNFINTKTAASYSFKECKTVAVTVITPYRDSFKISVPDYYRTSEIEACIIYKLNKRYPRRSVQIRPVEYNYSIM